MPAGNVFPSANVRFKDTRGAGAITVQGYELKNDENGFVECPARFEDILSAHGYLREGSVAYAKWFEAQPKLKK